MSILKPDFSKLFKRQWGEDWFAKNYPEYHDYIISHYNHEWKVAIYMDIHGLKELPVCPVCGKPLKFRDMGVGFSEYCSYSCASKAKTHPKWTDDCREKRRQTNLKKYGVEYAAQSQGVKDKSKQTNLKRYGVGHVSQTQQVKDKVKQTNLERYGGTGMASKQIRTKIQQTNLDKYNSVSPFGSLDVREKSKQTNLKKYGVEYAAQSQGVKDKSKQTNLKRYGVDNPMKNTRFQEKLKQTNLERYGVENVFSSVSIQDKIKQTIYKKYGVEYGPQSQQVHEKLKQTNLKKYGVEYPQQNPIIRSKTKQNDIEKYGVDDLLTLPEMQERMLNRRKELFILRNDFLLGYDSDGNWICKCPHTECEKCGEKTYTISCSLWHNRKVENVEPCTKLLPIQPTSYSTLELKIRSWLDELEIEYEANDRRFGTEMDIYIPSLQLAIEVNGSYWHSTIYKHPAYHVQKALLLAEKGVRCVFVWDDYKDEDIHTFISTLVAGKELNEWKEKWFPNIDGWPVDFGLVDGEWKEHICTHGGFECYDAGEIIKKEDL